MLDRLRCPIDKNFLFFLGHSGARLIFIKNYVNPRDTLDRFAALKHFGGGFAKLT